MRRRGGRRYGSRRYGGGCLLQIVLALLIVIAMALSGCGSSDTPPGIASGGIEITCMDVEYSAASQCNALPEGQNKPQRTASAALPLLATYDAGIINTGTNIWAQAEVTNLSALSADIYFYTEFNKNGVFNNNTAQTYSGTCSPGEIVNATYGSNPCPDAGPCVNDGYWEYVTYVYNAAHLAPDELGDPATDEVLAVGVLKFTLEAE